VCEDAPFEDIGSEMLFISSLVCSLLDQSNLSWCFGKFHLIGAREEPCSRFRDDFALLLQMGASPVKSGYF
jgi:hypothetical protein